MLPVLRIEKLKRDRDRGNGCDGIVFGKMPDTRTQLDIRNALTDLDIELRDAPAYFVRPTRECGIVVEQAI